MAFKHRRKRNAGLVYEFLVRRLASTMVGRDPDSYLKALGIAKRYYSPGEPLESEKSLFDVVVRTRGVSGQSAQRILHEVKRHAQAADVRLLEIKKSNLIKELNYAFGQGFFAEHRVPEYRLLASIQMLLDRYRNPSAPLQEDVERIGLEESLVTYMTSPVSRGKQAERADVDSFVAALAMRKFEDRYSGVLSESQRGVLRRFMNFSMSGDRERFSAEMERERETVLTTLREARLGRHFAEDQVMAGKLDEAISDLGSRVDLTSDQAVQDILLYRRLVEEIDSDEE